MAKKRLTSLDWTMERLLKSKSKELRWLSLIELICLLKILLMS